MDLQAYIQMKRDIRNKLNLKQTPDMYNTLSIAKKAANRTETFRDVVMGDNGLFWVVCMSDYHKLIKMGYEAA